MTTYFPPKRATAYVAYVSLISQANTKIMQANPTIASGDFKVSIDGGALANLTTLPSVAPASSKMVLISLSIAEMTGDNITIVCSDAAGAEWCDLVLNLQTTARQIDDLAYPATSGRSMVVDASGLVDANTVKVGPTGSGTAQTARDVGASVLLSSGTGAGQLDFTSGVVKANLAQILGTALTETAGLIAAGFKQFFNVATPTGTLNVIPTVTNLTTNNDKTGYSLSTAPLDAAGVRGAVGLASASLDTQLSGINSKTTNLPADPADASDVAAAISGLATSAALATVSGLVDDLETRLTSTRAGYLDNLSAGAVATQASVNAIDDLLDTEVAAIKLKTDLIPSDPAETSDIPSAAAVASQVRTELGVELGRIDVVTSTRLASAGYTTPPTATENATGLLDLAAGIETGLTLRQALRLLLAAEAGKLSGAETTTITIRNAVADSKNRLVVTVDENGNRSAFTYDVS